MQRHLFSVNYASISPIQNQGENAGWATKVGAGQSGGAWRFLDLSERNIRERISLSKRCADVSCAAWNKPGGAEPRPEVNLEREEYFGPARGGHSPSPLHSGWTHRTSCDPTTANWRSYLGRQRDFDCWRMGMLASAADQSLRNEEHAEAVEVEAPLPCSAWAARARPT